MKRKTIINLSVCLLHFVLCVLYVLIAQTFSQHEILAIIYIYILTFPLVLSVLSVYNLIESIIKKSYKNVMVWICAVAGLFVAFIYLGAFLKFIPVNVTSVSLVILCTVFTLIYMIGELIRRVTKNNVLTNAIYICSGILALIIAIVVVINAIPKYNENWIIGKTVEEITEKYGDYYWYSSRYARDESGNLILDENGEYINKGIKKIAYLTKPERVGFFGTDPEEFLVIWFDENGRAYKIQENWVTPGG